MTLLQGALADRDAWSAVGDCPIEQTMSVVGTKSAMLIMREAYYGTTRFDDFAQRIGVTKAAASARLSELVDLGLLTRQPYREPGQRTRDEYVLTEAGIDFMPVVWAMFVWGQRHLSGSNRLRLTHLDCGADASVEVRCAKGHPVPFDELGVELTRRNRRGP
ncbi:MAG TPA: helix-turn-helix domain-containing protein [Mycobacterium sp.]|uniref:winged helix-turn-helix transcriptional regulator n=1 Tax=Mycobacterium sp. TaxID=1785 RepID=UPI002BC0F57F|nr:helix-turn-helix domain-containing protein [Mycobacterium sp.]HXO82679.1 helix-turn-helix domain-containing protein [Mycobacterium sp.]